MPKRFHDIFPVPFRSLLRVFSVEDQVSLNELHAQTLIDDLYAEALIDPRPERVGSKIIKISRYPQQRTQRLQ